MATKAETLTASAPAGVQQDREAIFDIFRRWGYLQASLDPLGQFLPPEPFPITSTPEGDVAAEDTTWVDVFELGEDLGRGTANGVGHDVETSAMRHGDNGARDACR